MLMSVSVVRVPGFERIDKSFEEWKPKEYLTFSKGDAILCQSSLKMLSILQKYFQFLIFTPKCDSYNNYMSHILLLIEYYVLFSLCLDVPSFHDLSYADLQNHLLLVLQSKWHHLEEIHPETPQFLVPSALGLREQIQELTGIDQQCHSKVLWPLQERHQIDPE